MRGGSAAVAVVVVVAVVAVGGGVAFAASRRRGDPRVLAAGPAAGAEIPPGDPLAESLQIAGEAAVTYGGRALAALGKEAKAAFKPIGEVARSTGGKHVIRNAIVGGVTGQYGVYTAAKVTKATGRAVQKVASKLKFW